VLYCDQHGSEERITIMGLDEADASRGQVSWVAPIARALLKARIGDEVQLPTPGGVRVLEVLDVQYPEPGTS
jgi:transcription elongation factor GreB